MDLDTKHPIEMNIFRFLFRTLRALHVIWFHFILFNQRKNITLKMNNSILYTKLRINSDGTICETYYMEAPTKHHSLFIILNVRYQRRVTIFFSSPLLLYLSHLQCCCRVVFILQQAILNISPLRAFDTCNHLLHACVKVAQFEHTDKTRTKDWKAKIILNFL